VTSERFSRRLVRAYVRGLVPCVVLGAAMFALLVATALPPRSLAPDLARARMIVAIQWRVPVVAIHLALVMSGVLWPWVRGDRPARAAWVGVSRLPAIWIHVVVAQLMVALGVIAGIIPGVLALAPATLIAAAVAGGERGRGAFVAASAAAAPRRWPVVAIGVVAIAMEIGVTVATWKAIVPPLGKKTPAAGLYAATRFAWINAGRTAITTPVIATLFASLYRDDRPQVASAPRTAAASAHAITS